MTNELKKEQMISAKADPPALLCPYPGSKFRLMEKYVPMFPSHKWFVSVFGGMAAEFAWKEPTPREVYNDLDGWLNSVWCCLQDEQLCRQLAWRLEHTPDGQENFSETAGLMDSTDVVDRAYAFLVLSTCSFIGPHPATRKPWYASGAKARPSYLFHLPKKIAAWRERFRRVKVEKLDWSQVIDHYDAPDTFFQIDPPYDPTTRFKNPLYFLDKIDHKALLTRLNGIEGKALVCGYPSVTYNLYLHRWRRVETRIRKLMQKKVPVTEVAWLNYDENGDRLDTSMDWMAELLN